MASKEQYKQHVRHYCCLYHFTTGKTSKSSTPCFNHVSLGIINPIHSTLPRSTKSPDQNLRIQAKPHEVQFHNHYLNQIENKQSLPKRLYYPRVYVQQIHSKRSYHGWNQTMINESFLKNKSFQEIFLLFKRFARLTKFASEQEVIKSVQDFWRNNGINKKQNQQNSSYLLKKDQFINYLIQFGLENKEAQVFWQAAFNKNRFKSGKEKNNSLQVVSMRAFTYNFKKFYLDELESYRNCLSQPALRQRMIDLRLFLEPWFTKNIIFKQNHQHWKQLQLQICEQLQKYKEDELYLRLITCIQVRNKIWLFMRTLAKIFYELTDQKNIGLEIFNQRATSIILKNKQNLQISAELLDKFETHLLSSNRSKQQKILITDLFQFGRVHFPQKEQQIIWYLRGLYKYLYFFKRASHLQLNHQSLNIDCSQIGETTYNQLIQFLSYKQESTDQLMQMIENICNEVNEAVDSRPQISGHKQFLNQCNYIAQAILKMIKRMDFVIFYRLQKVRSLYQDGQLADINKFKLILNEEETKDDNSVKQKFWKKTFQFIKLKQTSVSRVKTQSNEANEKNYEYALDLYEDLKNRLEGKIPIFSLNAGRNTKAAKEEKEVEPKKQKISRKNRQSNKNITSDKNDLNQQIERTEVHKCYGSHFCSICDEICSTSVNDSLYKIENMSDYLMDLLKNI